MPKRERVSDRCFACFLLGALIFGTLGVALGFLITDRHLSQLERLSGQNEKALLEHNKLIYSNLDKLEKILTAIKEAEELKKSAVIWNSKTQ